MLVPVVAHAQHYGTPRELRVMTPTIEDAAPGTMPSPDAKLSGVYQRQPVYYRSNEAPGTIIIDTPHRFLYLIQPNNVALRYGVGVGRDGFQWNGLLKITRKQEWPDWTPPPEMIERQPYLPRFMAGGPGNPMGARALYLGSTVYRIHGTNAPETIGHAVSSGCFRLVNDEIADLYERVPVGTKVIVQQNEVSGMVSGGRGRSEDVAAAAGFPLRGNQRARYILAILLQRRRGLAEQDGALLGGADAARARIDLLRLCVGAHDRRARFDRVEPALEMREVGELLALALPRHDPRIARHVGDGIFAGEEWPVGEPLVHHAVEPVGLVAIALDRVRELLGRVIAEVIVLPGHRPEPAHLPEQPLHDVGGHAARFGRNLPVFSAR